MIDCSKTMNYFIEKSRMIKQQKDGVCKLDCSDCPLSISNNGTDISCSHFETGYPEEAIAIMQKWSDEHPQKTYLSEFLKHYPNAELSHGVPKTCLKKLGVVSGCAKTKKVTGILAVICAGIRLLRVVKSDGN